MPNGVQVQVMIANNRFSTSFSGDGWSGKISGEIKAGGKLVGKGYAQKPQWRLRQLKFSAPYTDGAFKATAASSTGTYPLSFRITLRR